MENTIHIVEEENNSLESIDCSQNNEERSSENISPHNSNVHEHHNLYPHIGLEFDSLDGVKNFYKAFAKEEGFGVRIRSTKPNSCMLVCSNAGQHVVNSNGNEESNTITGKDETEKSFTWLFETWLKAMGGKSPVSIITDQDLAIGAAISKVFPHTRHRLCLWHIRKKFPEKLSHIYHKNSVFKRDLKRCIRESSCINDFEEDWHRIMVEYDLEKNEWLQGLYNMRELWIPVYNRNTFFAGMNTTQRSESINAFFDSFVDSSTTLRDFVTKFDKAVDSRYEKERKEDFESRHRSRMLSVGSKLEEHAANLYTRNIFNKFQDELAKVSKFIKEKIDKNGTQHIYKVSSCFNSRDSFIVSVDLDTRDAKCGCQLYEFMGILCRHILVIYQAKNVVEIPNKYILQRWTKDANKGFGFGVNETNSV